MRSPLLPAILPLLLLACASDEPRRAPVDAAPVPATASKPAEKLPPVVAAAIAAYDAEVSGRRAAFEAKPARPDDWRWVREKLAHMVDVDQFMRAYSQSDIVVRFDDDERRAFDQAFLPRWRSVDEANTRDLKQLLAAHGWFTISAFGPKADRNAWLLVQHADHDVPFQREVLTLLDGLVASRETDVRNYAYLYDRVAVAEGREQRYGTQGRCVAPGRWEPHPIEDPTNVDARRAAAELEPLADYVARFVDLCD